MYVYKNKLILFMQNKQVASLRRYVSGCGLNEILPLILRVDRLRFIIYPLRKILNYKIRELLLEHEHPKNTSLFRYPL